MPLGDLLLLRLVYDGINHGKFGIVRPGIKVTSKR